MSTADPFIYEPDEPVDGIKPTQPDVKDYRIQLWQLIAIFGKHLVIGNDPPFETTIMFNENDFTD